MAKKNKEGNKKSHILPKEKKRFLGMTALHWTALGVFATIVGSVWGGVALCRQNKGESAKSDESTSLNSIESEPLSKTDTQYIIIKNEPTRSVDSNLNSFSPVFDDAPCVVVYLKGEPRSEKDARIVANQLKKIFEEDFVVFPKETLWFKMNFPVNSDAIDTGSNVLVWISDKEYKELGQQVYLCVSHSRYALDSSVGRWVRADTLPFNKPGSEVVFADVQPETLMQGKFGLHKYPVAVIIPPYPFYKQAK